MQVTIYIADWHEVLNRLEAGSLELDLPEAIDNDEGWAEELDWFPQSNNDYVMVAEAWEAIRGCEQVDPEIDARAQKFMNQLITFNGYRMDLPREGLEVIAISLSPESVTEFLQTIAEVDFEGYREQFYSRCDQHTLDRLIEFSDSKTLENCFNEGFFAYVKFMVDALVAASAKGWGLLIQMG